MKNVIATIAISTFLMLAFGPVQLQGLPGHLRTHDGVMAENEETERAVVEALLAMARSQDDKTTANEQQHQNQVANNEQYPQQKTGQQQNVTALMMQYIWNKMMKNQQTLATNQRRENRGQQSARSQQWIPIAGKENARSQQWIPIASEENARSQYRGPYAGRQSARSQYYLPPYAGEENALAQQSPSGIDIRYCGPVGDIIKNALQFGLGFIPGGNQAYGVYIACAEQPMYPCTTVTVAVPAGDIKADIDVCDYGKSMNSC